MSPGALADLDGLLHALTGVPVSTDAEHLRRSSRDMSAMLSPTLAGSFADRQAGAVVSPRDEDEVRAVLSACAVHAVPVVPRGAGTSNFGQSVPLRGGVVLDLRALVGVLRVEPGWWRARTGTLLGDVDDALRVGGQELRVFPSSKRVGTVGGYVVGGHAGPGAVRHGVLADRGNILGLRVLTLEPSPRALEVRGEDVDLVHFSFGTAGVVTEVEMPAAPAWAWCDLVLGFPDLPAATAFALEVVLADGLDVKNVHPVDAAVAAHLTPLGLPAGRAAALCMVAPHSREGLLALGARHGATVELEAATGEGPRGIPLYEYTWGHSVFWVRKAVPDLATVIALLPEADPVGALASLLARLGRPLWVAVSCKRFAGRPALQLALCVDGGADARLAEVSAVATGLGCSVADTHRPVLSASSIYGFGERQRAWKRDVDPLGLLNPGKLAEVDAADTDARLSGGLVASGFDARR